MTDELRYEDFCSEEEVEQFKWMKWFQSSLARIGREEAALMVSGEIGDGDRSEKEFLRTAKGLFRMANRVNTDNSSEEVIHRGMKVELVIMGESQMKEFFELHDLEPENAYWTWIERVRARADGFTDE